MVKKKKNLFSRLAGSYSLLLERFLNKSSEVEKRLCWQVPEINWKGEAVRETFICLYITRCMIFHALAPNEG